MSKITPFVRCESNAAELAAYYLSIFPESKLCKQNDIVVTIEIFGQTLGFINGGPHAKPNPSISLSLWIKDQALCEMLRSKLSDGGQVMMEYQAYERSPAYGRCNDKYGVSRQVMRDNRAETSTHAMVPSMMFIGTNNGKTKEAMDYYCSIFPNSAVDFTRPYGENEFGENPEHLNHAEFKLSGQQFIAMDSGMNHKFQFDDGVSLAVSCDGQEETDYYREKLIADGGSEVQCGRCKDKYGVSRQIVPIQSQQAIFHADTPEAGAYAMQQMMQMKKIVIKDLYK
jgi:predicted 3-demethylubiquinone-9 3-methyltransferase (glyoxalase superfamily)